MDITVVDFLPSTFLPGSGVYVRGKENMPDMLFDMTNGRIYTTDYIYTYMPFTDCEVPEPLLSTLKRLSGTNIGSWGEKEEPTGKALGPVTVAGEYGSGSFDERFATGHHCLL